MKLKMIALTLALTVMSWAQTASPTTPSAPQQSTAAAEKGKGPCCDKMAADARDGQKCAAHVKHADGREMACWLLGQGHQVLLQRQ